MNIKRCAAALALSGKRCAGGAGSGNRFGRQAHLTGLSVGCPGRKRNDHEDLQLAIRRQRGGCRTGGQHGVGARLVSAVSVAIDRDRLHHRVEIVACHRRIDRDLVGFRPVAGIGQPVFEHRVCCARRQWRGGEPGNRHVEQLVNLDAHRVRRDRTTGRTRGVGCRSGVGDQRTGGNTGGVGSLRNQANGNGQSRGRGYPIDEVLVFHRLPIPILG